MNDSRRNALVGGLILIGLGVIFLLDNLNLVPGGVSDWWPVLVIGAGIALLAQSFRQRRSGGLVGGTMLLGLGGYWLLANLGRVSDNLFLPVLFISLGAGLLLRTLIPSRL
jgi:hypothetical protein